MNLETLILKHGPIFESKVESIDSNNLFVRENLQALKADGVYKMMIPQDLGGAGVSYLELCRFIKTLAIYCPSTALTLSMHQNLIAGLVFKHQSGDSTATNTLKMVAEKNLVLLTTGGGDWLSSNGHSEKVAGGYKINCRKSFCSGAQLADVAVTSCAFEGVNQGLNEKSIIHFSVPMNSEGITIFDDWNAMGMKGTGSCSVEFKDVFVAEEKITLKRERGVWHPALDMACTFAFPVVMSTYIGVAEKLVENTLQLFSSREKVETHSLTSLGEMKNHFKIAEWAYQQLLDNSDNLKAAPSQELASQAQQAKSILTQHSIQCAQAAMQALGGFSYYQRAGVERLYRDLIAGEFHPIQAAKQKQVLGGFLLGGSLAG